MINPLDGNCSSILVSLYYKGTTFGIKLKVYLEVKVFGTKIIAVILDDGVGIESSTVCNSWNAAIIQSMTPNPQINEIKPLYVL